MELEQNKEELNVIKSEVVTFFEDGNVATCPTGNVRPEPFYLKPAKDTLENSVIGFLSRPLEQQNLTWNLSDARGAQIGTGVDLPAVWMNNNMMKEKYSGMRFIRCTFRCKAQVNAQKFNAGMLIMFFEPLASQQNFRPSNAVHLGGITGYDPVFLDVSDSTSMELNIPFCANISHYDLITGAGLAGQVRIYVYSPLTGGTAGVDGTLWVTAEDIDVQMATGVSPLPRAIAQSGLTSGAGAGITSSRASGSSTSIVPDSEKSGGSVEALARKIGSVARSASGVPAVAIPARALSYVADAAAGVASIFGWSRPDDSSFATTVVPSYLKNFTNYNGDSKAKVLALEARNSIKTPSDVFGTDVDEMSFSHILRKKSWMTYFPLTTTAVANQIIWKWPVTPDACLRVPLGLYNYKLNTYLSYHAENFYSFRGGIRYHFKVVKSIFHTARIRVSYISGLLYGSTLTTVDINRVYSRIYDIRDLTEFEFTVPYVNNAPWHSLNDAFAGTLSPYTDTVPTGVVVVEVINALRAPATCAQEIDFIVSTSAAEDFQFAIPTQSSWAINNDSAFVGTSGLTVGSPDVISDKVSLGNPKKRTMKSHFSHLFEDLNDIPVVKGVNPVFQTPKEFQIYHSKKPVVPSIAETPNEVTAELDLVTNQIESRAPLLMEPGTMDFYRGLADDYWRRFVDMVDKVRADDVVKARFIAAFLGVYEQTPVAERPDLAELVVDPQLIPIVTIQKHDPLLVERGKMQSADLIVPTDVDTGHEINAFGMGEVVTGWRQILKRYDGFGAFSPTDAPGPTKTYGLFPADMGNRWPMANVPPPDMSNTYNVNFTRAAALYRYWCGSIRISMYRNSSFTSNQQWRWAPTTVITVPSTALVGTTPVVNTPVRAVNLSISSYSNAGLPRSLYFPNTEEVSEAKSVFYQRYPALPTQVGGIDYVDLESTSSILNKNPSNFGSLMVILTSNGMELNRAIGEDFSFGYLIGPPITRRLIITPP